MVMSPVSLYNMLQLLGRVGPVVMSPVSLYNELQLLGESGDCDHQSSV